MNDKVGIINSIFLWNIDETKEEKYIAFDVQFSQYP